MIKNIIFDLGGVILDNDWSKTRQAFKHLGIDIDEFLFSSDFWETLDNSHGSYSLEIFADLLREKSGLSLSNSDIEKAWCALLCDFNAERMAGLEKLANTYNLYLFSNTDSIHTKAFESKCLQQCGKPLISYFNKIYYSWEIGMRKPDTKAFHEVLRLSGLTADECLFIDDKLENVEAARAVGLQAMQVTEALTALDFVKLSSQ